MAAFYRLTVFVISALSSLVISLLIGGTAFASPFASSVPVDELPPLVRDSQEILARQNICQREWKEMAGATGSQKIALGKTSEMFIVPCAKWAVNVGVTVFIKVLESTQPDGYVVLPMRFASYNSYLGLIGQDQVHNLIYLPDEQILLSTYYNDPTGICGTKAAYKWHRGHQKFILIDLQKRDDCRDSSAEWQKISLKY